MVDLREYDNKPSETIEIGILLSSWEIISLSKKTLHHETTYLLTYLLTYIITMLVNLNYELKMCDNES
jgi:hypothetical protein